MKRPDMVQPEMLDIPSPLGRLRLEASAHALLALRFCATGGPSACDESPVLARAARALASYFGGAALGQDVPLDLTRLPPFHREVLGVLRGVPAGSVVTYGELAKRAGRPGAARAVGTAMARNPLPIFVPCHRVVGTRGLGGFGPGLAHKRWLLALEGVSV